MTTSGTTATGIPMLASAIDAGETSSSGEPGVTSASAESVTRSAASVASATLAPLLTRSAASIAPPEPSTTSATRAPLVADVSGWSTTDSLVDGVEGFGKSSATSGPASVSIRNRRPTTAAIAAAPTTITAVRRRLIASPQLPATVRRMAVRLRSLCYPSCWSPSP